MNKHVNTNIILSIDEKNYYFNRNYFGYLFDMLSFSEVEDNGIKIDIENILDFIVDNEFNTGCLVNPSFTVTLNMTSYVSGRYISDIKIVDNIKDTVIFEGSIKDYINTNRVNGTNE